MEQDEMTTENHAKNQSEFTILDDVELDRVSGGYTFTDVMVESFSNQASTHFCKTDQGKLG